MADKKISELTSITGANINDANDTIAIVDSSAGQTKKITREELFKDVDGAIFKKLSLTVGSAVSLAFDRGQNEVSLGIFSNSDDIQYRVNNSPAGVLPAGPALSSNHFLKQSDGDARYAELSGATFTGDVEIQEDNDVTLTLTTNTSEDVRIKFVRPAGSSYEFVNDSGVFKLKRGASGATDTFDALKVSSGDKWQFYDSSDGTEIARMQPATSGLPTDNTVVTRVTGDARYAQLSGATFTGDLTLTNPSLATLRVKRGSDGRVWGIGTVGDSTAMSIYDVLNNNVAARIDEQGTTAGSGQTVITREKGDARYAELSGATFTGAVTLGAGQNYVGNNSGSTLNFLRDNGPSFLDSAKTGDDLFRFRDGSNTSVAQIDGAGTAASVPLTLMTREKGDARYIAERGSNANGEYVRFSDGTQICWSPEFSSVSVTSAVGSIYRSSVQTWTYPATFSSTEISGSVSNVGNSQTHWGVLRADSTTTADITVFSFSSATARKVRAVAIGRWK